MFFSDTLRIPTPTEAMRAVGLNRSELFCITERCDFLCRVLIGAAAAIKLLCGRMNRFTLQKLHNDSLWEREQSCTFFAQFCLRWQILAPRPGYDPRLVCTAKLTIRTNCSPFCVGSYFIAADSSQFFP
jgi:hypothetical protein